MAEPNVAVVVLNYNGKDITLQAIQSLLQMRYGNFELIVVDNGSTDGSFEAVSAAYPNIVQVRTAQNRGVSGGYNLGLERALEGDYDYVLTLNNDIEAAPDFLTELVRLAETDPRIGAVGPKTYYYWDRQRIWSAGGIIRFKESVTRERGLGEIDRGQYDRDQDVAYVNGNGMLIRRAALEQVGLWDSTYYLTVEDADWCMRLGRRGFRIVYAHRAVLYHMVSYATGIYREGRTFQTGRSTAIFVRRYANPWQWLTFLLFAGAALPVAYLREWRKGNQKAAVAKLRGLLEGLRMPLPPSPAPVSSLRSER